MNVWTNAVLTDKGRALLAKLTQGNTLDITRAVTGSGFVTPGFLSKQTEVTDPKQSLTFKPVSYPEVGKCAFPVVLTNEGLATGYEATQVGIFATDPDDGEILFFIVQSTDASSGTTVPSESEMPGYSAEWTFYFQYGQADSVNVTVDPGNTVSREELIAYIDDEFVPITAAQIDELIGLYGDVDNSGTGSGTGSGGGVGTLDHSLLYNRNISDQHTIESITGLEDALTAAEGSQLDSASVETAWDNAT